MYRKFEFSENEFYHLYNRGNDKRTVFLDDNDRKRFIKLLFLANNNNPINLRDIPLGRSFVEMERGQTIVDIGAYCLMPNHFHLLVCEKKEGGISNFMKKLCTSHSMYFNMKYGRTGSLFEGVFKAEHAEKDEYLEYLFAYIHLNPIKLIEPEWYEKGLSDTDKAKKFLENYRYSSYPDYIGESRPETAILNKNAFSGYFENQKEFKDYINDWLNYQKVNT
ncbi:MAG: transposase [Patescibacteria group bacterium]